MTDITIKNLEMSFVANLRNRAREHGCSVEEEARELLKKAILGDEPQKGLGTAIRSRVEHLGGVELELQPRGTMSEPPTLD